MLRRFHIVNANTASIREDFRRFSLFVCDVSAEVRIYLRFIKNPEGINIQTS